MIKKFISALRKAGIEPTPEEVADVLWYAAQKPFPITASGEPLQKRQNLAQKSSQSTESTAQSTEETATQESHLGEEKHSQHQKSLRLSPTDTDNQKGGIPFCTPGASALPGALKLARALRPLMRRIPSSHCVVLDEEATIHQITQYKIAKTNIWIPVQRPISTPWLEIALVVESSPSMHLWQQTVQELRLLLERQGAFRDVRVWKLDTSCPDKMALSTGASSTKHSYRELINPAMPRVILMVTDCISPVWQSGKISDWLTAWGHTHPVALLQMLPQQLWRQTQVSTAHLLRVTAPYPGAPNKSLKRTTRSPWLARQLPTGIATPIITLEPDFMSAWVQLIANPTDTKKLPALIFKQATPSTAQVKSESSTANKTVTSVLTATKRFIVNNLISPFFKSSRSYPDKSKQPSIARKTLSSKPSAAQHFAAFKASASPTTVKLASLLAAAPLRLPIMRLVQHTMLPESQQVHLAEFFLSGLLKRIDTNKDISDPDEMVYDFLSDDDFDIRGKLLDAGLMPDAIQVQQMVSSYIAEHYGQPNDFQAMLENPDLITNTTVDSKNQFFASVSIEVLRRLGGRYAKAANLLIISNNNNNPIESENKEGRDEIIQKGKLFKFEIVTVNAKGEIAYRENKQARYQTEDLGNGVTLEMVYIPGGTFMMGSPEDEERRKSNEGPQHRVTIQPFFMGKYLVTQAQWQTIMGNNPSHFKGENRPVEQVSWNDAVEFCQKLSKMTSKEYRLPSETEWEYACRAGTTTPFYFGETITPDLANYDGNYNYASGPKGVFREETTEVGRFPPNAFGLYDMHGNLWEWVADKYHNSYNGSPGDNSVWEEGGEDYRVLRGGSWSSGSYYSRVAVRNWGDPDYRANNRGFRVFRCLAART
ncbi:formylglycine-generating enzyme family protein [Candidatus Parabeggiatoa sp. HSG14]|uniref:formylglycine-generating enzyme family protein n=1 Tax=Candidatus Parabeggiatoa sp. HSG14 TaxID=3055593 RepID=UPI0025A72F0F|nr:formylglycine-generating enzyme family protein [Thiotrichales bacterium HSG14]